MSLFSATEVASPGGAAPLGFRLHGLEVYNWGTFDGRVWSFPVEGHTALLTGDIGSGKSTLVDAVTTLLLPAHRVSYNKAAGGTTRERDLRSYVRGYYRSERNETTGTTRPVALRPRAQTYSVILGVFRNAGFDATVTLAQVFSTNGTQGQPDRFFVVAEEELSIVEHFAGFGGDLAALRRRLRHRGAQLHTTFPPYGNAYRRALSIDSEQAMELFHQTVSMKSVTDLNDFVRSHMLEPFDADGWIDRLVGHFEDLTRAHDAVLTARRQVDQLVPLLADAARHDEQAQRIARLSGAQEHLARFVAARKHALLQTDLERTREQKAVVAEQARLATTRAGALTDRRDALIEERAGAGGDRIGEIGRQLDAAIAERDRRRAIASRVASLLSAAGLPPAESQEQFVAALAAAERAGADLGPEREAAQEEVTQIGVARKGAEAESAELNAELLSLKSRRTNLPRQSLQIREDLCAALEVDPVALPFAGELIQIRPEHAEWEGAAERVLRSFGLSLLVPEVHYRASTEWIDTHHLKMRLVYFRVPNQLSRSSPQVGGGQLLHTKLHLREESPMYEWLERQLLHRAGQICATTMEEFRRAERAVTRSGQIRDGPRHEKNDTFHIDDRSRYVLGWSNQAKIDALLARAAALHGTLQRLDVAAKAAAQRQAALQERGETLTLLGHHRSWEEIDWQAQVGVITALEVEQRRLESSSGELSRITEALRAVEAEQAQVAAEQRALSEEQGRLQESEKARVAGLRACEEAIDANPERDAGATAALHERAGANTPSTPDGWDGWERLTRSAIDAERESARAEQVYIGTRMQRAMNRFRHDFPAQTAEMDAAVEAIEEYRALHARLAQDDLPRFESEFKTYLNTNTIRDVAGFQAELNKQLTLIRERITKINDSLIGIDYNPGRYIRLETERTPSMEVRQFQTDLRSCTEGALGVDHDEQYSETKFLQVKAIIERFRGRTGQTEADRSWTRRVTDVRNWYVFIASERHREGDAEHESYADSGGKSGGQKEKLAYTILAASLAYQFKLDWGVERSKTFRFVVIDEAFGRGSDESTRFGLELFARLGLQLVIVTPLQKIHVIEPYVQRVGFADNRSGRCSQLQTLTIEEFRERHTERRRLAAAYRLVQLEG